MSNLIYPCGASAQGAYFTADEQSADIRATLTSSKAVRIYWGEGRGGSQQYTDMTADGAEHTYTYNYVSNKDSYLITIEGDVDYITTLDLSTGGYDVSGHLANLFRLTGLTSLDLGDTDFEGSTGNLAPFTGMVTIDLTNCSGIDNSMAGFIDMTSLATLKITGTSINDAITWLGGLGSLATIEAANLGLTGDLEAFLDGMLATLTATLNGNDFSYSNGALPAFSSTINVASCGLSSGEVDYYLINQAANPAGSGDRVITINGTNAARTSASDAAKATLLASGYTVNVNE